MTWKSLRIMRLRGGDFQAIEPNSVIPTKVGIQITAGGLLPWIPAFAHGI